MYLSYQGTPFSESQAMTLSHWQYCLYICFHLTYLAEKRSYHQHLPKHFVKLPHSFFFFFLRRTIVTYIHIRAQERLLKFFNAWQLICQTKWNKHEFAIESDSFNCKLQHHLIVFFEVIESQQIFMCHCTNSKQTKK